MVAGVRRVFTELRRRSVFKVAAVHAANAFVVWQAPVHISKVEVGHALRLQISRVFRTSVRRIGREAL